VRPSNHPIGNWYEGNGGHKYSNRGRRSERHTRRNPRHNTALILFRPDKKSRLTFPGLPTGVIPLTPSRALFNVTSRTSRKVKITRSQYAITAGYAFTEGLLSPFSVYVALSRSRGRDTIRLLREFDANLFQNHPSKKNGSQDRTDRFR